MYFIIKFAFAFTYSYMDIQNQMKRHETSLFLQVIKGIGQIMLQDNVFTGIIILSGIFYGSLTMGLAALLGSVSGTLVARVLKYKPSDINSGLYGFSAALVGVGIATFFKPYFVMWMLIPAGSAMAAMIQHFFIKREIPVYTLPFVLISWVALYFAGLYYPDILVDVTPTSVNEVNNYDFALKSFGQVIFQDNLVSSACFIIAVFFSSPVAAVYGLAGAVLASFIAFHLSYPAMDINNGLYGFNVVLCAITFAGTSLKDGIWVLVATTCSFIVRLIMIHFGWMQLTFPFVLASMVTYYLKKAY